jgi:hypothetical protein
VTSLTNSPSPNPRFHVSPHFYKRFSRKPTICIAHKRASSIRYRDKIKILSIQSAMALKS